jgi:hypothetical protein
MDPCAAFLRDVLLLAAEIYFRRVEAELWKFAEALDEWLHELFAHPRPDWRESFDQLLAQQEAEGRLIVPKSRQELLDFLEGWAEGIDWRSTLAHQQETEQSAHSPEMVATRTSQPAVAMPKKPTERSRVGRQYQRKWIQREIRESFFNMKLAEAKRRLDEMEQVLEALGRKLDGAKPDEVVEVESEVNDIETLIWRHNDALESARDAWLRDDLGSRAFDRLMLMLSPAALHLPLFTDDQQAERARMQWKQIAKRLDQRIAMFDRIIFGAKAVEAAGTAASLALGAGVVLTAVKQGGKWAVVKTVAKVAASGAAAYGAGEALEHGLRAAGASEETIHGVRLAAEVVTWLLLLRRIHSSGAKLPASKRPKTGNRNAKVPDASNETTTGVPKPGAKHRRSASDGKRSKQRRSTYLRGRYSGSASDPGAYWASEGRVFPTRRNSGLSDQILRAEQENFFLRGLREGRSPGMLRGQAAAAGYERRGGINNVGGPDRLADKGAEQALQRAMMKVSKTRRE